MTRPKIEAMALQGLEFVHWQQGNLEQASEAYQQALTISQKIGDRSGQGIALNGLGTVHRDEGRYSQAIDRYQQALKIRTETRDRAGEGHTLKNLGIIYNRLGQYPQAEQQLSAALERLEPLRDGLLTSSEILDLNLNAALVVLSACDTGRGKITSDGVIGLSRSFISAGTPSIMVSLWAVPDAPTAALMVEFYQQWQTTGNKAKALRLAMLKMIEESEEPEVLAAFTLMGETD